jgi:hypothetical protein
MDMKSNQPTALNIKMATATRAMNTAKAAVVCMYRVFIQVLASRVAEFCPRISASVLSIGLISGIASRYCCCNSILMFTEIGEDGQLICSVCSFDCLGGEANQLRSKYSHDGHLMGKTFF